MKHTIGIDDDEFIRGNIPMTKQEVRILAITKAAIGDNDTVLDIGAGTGSLTVEAALLAKYGTVYAVEREPEGIELIKANAGKFGITNVEVIAGKAPDVLRDLPAMDVIFIGGSGGKLADIVKQSTNLLKREGRLIITAVTVETLYHALQLVQQSDTYKVEAFGVQITRIRKVSASNMLQALNPIYIISCEKRSGV